jgi:hypothetical protein
MAVFAADTALNTIKASATAMAALRAAAQYSVVSWSETNASDVTLALTGSSHIVLGASRSSATARANTLKTVRSGSAVSGVTPATSGAANALGKDFDVAIPIVSPFSAMQSGTGTGTGYLGILRCDL